MENFILHYFASLGLNFFTQLIALYACIMGIAYLIGSIPFGLLLTKAAGLGDIRTVGSGNIGATNVLRTGNKKLALLTLLLDGLKGYGAVWLLTSNMVIWFIPGLLVIIGHVFPLWLHFKGGKGVSTALGVCLAVSWQLGVCLMGIWLSVFLMTRISSLSAICTFVALPVIAYFFYSVEIYAQWLVLLIILPVLGQYVNELILSLAPMIFTTFISLLVIWRHKNNIKRLIAGTEPRFGSKL